MSEYGDIRFATRDGLRCFRRPVEVCTTHRIEDVMPCLHAVKNHVERGLTAAGFLAYEAAPAFEPALRCHANAALPLLWFGLYEGPSECEDCETEAFQVGTWEPSLSRADYVTRVQRLRELIAAGDSYQINLTFPMHAAFRGSALAWFRALCKAQPTDFACYLNAGRHHIVSVSPELFVERYGATLRVRPMKGTAPRGRYPQEDEANAHNLAASEKDRAENVMIVDLLRNDLGRVSETGSVHVERLFDVERYPTVWQMTSTIVSQSPLSMPEVLAALFPSGSVTGAPKVRTMEIIRDIESGPRGVYCGAIGWWEPSGRASFSVAIRTATVDTETRIAEYPVGSGITWDSDPNAEYDECLAKAAVLTAQRPDFSLLESIRYDCEYFLLERHLERLAESAQYFDIACDVEAVRCALADAAGSFSDAPRKVRVLVGRGGAIHVESAPAAECQCLRLGLAASPVDSSDAFLFHKTTHRAVYEAARASRPDCDDVLLWNERGEITESTVANVVVDLDGRLVTPLVSCGLLAGTFRAELLERGEIDEAVVMKDDLVRCRTIHLINSVRRWIRVDFVHGMSDAPEPVSI
jgi:para-aminobenzoate synthetase/4-amino-4-deoxychorismate lyase